MGLSVTFSLQEYASKRVSCSPSHNIYLLHPQSWPRLISNYPIKRTGLEQWNGNRVPLMWLSRQGSCCRWGLTRGQKRGWAMLVALRADSHQWGPVTTVEEKPSRWKTGHSKGDLDSLENMVMLNCVALCLRDSGCLYTKILSWYSWLAFPALVRSNYLSTNNLSTHPSIYSYVKTQSCRECEF